MTEEKLEKAKNLKLYKDYLQGTYEALKGLPITFHELQIGYNQGMSALVADRAHQVNKKVRDFMMQVVKKEIEEVTTDFEQL